MIWPGPARRHQQQHHRTAALIKNSVLRHSISAHKQGRAVGCLCFQAPPHFGMSWTKPADASLTQTKEKNKTEQEEGCCSD